MQHFSHGHWQAMHGWHCSVFFWWQCWSTMSWIKLVLQWHWLEWKLFHSQLGSVSPLSLPSTVGLRQCSLQIQSASLSLKSTVFCNIIQPGNWSPFRAMTFISDQLLPLARTCSKTTLTEWTPPLEVDTRPRILRFCINFLLILLSINCLFRKLSRLCPQNRGLFFQRTEHFLKNTFKSIMEPRKSTTLSADPLHLVEHFSWRKIPRSRGFWIQHCWKWEPQGW